MKYMITPNMPAEAVLEFVQLLTDHNIEVILDGGWAVDALIGKQTRLHEDLDIAVFHKNVPCIREMLEERGYREIPRDDSRECNFVYGNQEGHLIDIHSCTFDDQGNHIFGVAYTLDAFSGSGEIEGHPVRCIPPEILMEYHTGYPLDRNDFHDVSQLSRKFGLKIPEDYQKFVDINPTEGDDQPK